MKLIIIGGVAGGASAAARARRINEDAEIILFERGKYISFANCGLPYYIGGEIQERKNLLVTTPQKLRSRFNVDVRILSEVIRIDPKNKKVTVKNLKNGKTYDEKYDKLIISSGAEPFKPPIPGVDLENVFTLRNIPDTDKIKKYVDDNTPCSAVVIGGGFIGLEMAENLVIRGVKVTLIEMLDQILPPLDFEMAALIQDHLVDNGVELRLQQAVKKIEEQNGKTMVTTSTGGKIECDMVILSAGVRPENALAKEAGIKIGRRGGIIVDDYLQTSNPDIYAVGDVIEVKDFVTGEPTMIPLAGPANKQGRIAADNVMGRKVAFNGTQGSSIVKVVDMVAASTGDSEKQLKKANINYRKIYVHLGSHASYYPGAQQMTIKLLFHPEGGKVLGAQIVGVAGVDKRIDILATAIRANMTVFDLEELELAYAPPFSSAKDPVNMAGVVAANILRGDVGHINWDQIECLDREKNQFLDVRDFEEIELSGNIPGSVTVPLDQLRNNLDKLDKNKNIITYCGTGLRSYIATRILRQKGFNARNLSGGYKTYSMIKESFRDKPMEMCVNNREEEEQPVLAQPEELVNIDDIQIDKKIDATGLQCPGPIMRLKDSINEMENGQILQLKASDPGFKKDAQAWCRSTGNRLLHIETEKGIHTAVIKKGGAEAATGGTPLAGKKKTIIVFSDDLDRALAAFIIANGAASMGSDVTMFFTFWGLNILRKENAEPVKKDLLEKMFGAMMPRGADKLTLSKLNMMGMGTNMMKYVMKNKNVDSLQLLIENARNNGVRLVACNMTMDIMGIKKEELIENVEEAGVASYLETAEKSHVNLFI
ncbi:MAG: FAD-dependent oxidoreductase [Vulcanimicrobiota bacterium]